MEQLTRDELSDETRRIVDAATGRSMPINSKAMLGQIRAALEEGGTNHLGDLDGEELIRAKAALWVINAHVHGELSTIDMMDEWDELNEINSQ